MGILPSAVKNEYRRRRLIYLTPSKKTRQPAAPRPKSKASVQSGEVQSRKPILRLIPYLIIILLMPFLCGIVWQASANSSETKQNPQPGQLVAVDDHQLHIYCIGQGSPTVVLESGVPEWSIHWRKVQKEVARFTRVCAYDRAGYGWSEPGPEPRTATQIVTELHTLLANAGEKGPFVLAAHSLWGPAALLYQHNYPDEVSGLVLVESWSPELFSPTPAVIQQSISINESLGKMAPFGLLRFLRRTGILPLDDLLKADLLPEDVRPALQSEMVSQGMWATMSQEYRAMDESAKQLQVLDSLGDLPLVVIKAGQREPNDYPPDEVWDQTQEQLSKLSTNGRLVVAKDSGHFVQLEAPEVVVQAIRDLVEQGKK
jgi:pimeloyl-ACP methyl ester carboxylesterase